VGEEGFVCAAGCEVAVRLIVSVWVGYVGGLVTEWGQEGDVLPGEARADVEAMGLVRERGEKWWNMVPASRWALTRL
jgi:hypothetical protein